VALPETRNPVDEIGNVDPAAIGAMVTRYCSGVSPSDIIRLVPEVLPGSQLVKTTGLRPCGKAST
jgi:hypothetical protein